MVSLAWHAMTLSQPVLLGVRRGFAGFIGTARQYLADWELTKRFRSPFGKL